MRITDFINLSISVSVHVSTVPSSTPSREVASSKTFTEHHQVDTTTLLLQRHIYDQLVFANL